MKYEEFCNYIKKLTYKDYSFFECYRKGDRLVQVALVSYRSDVVDRITENKMTIRQLPAHAVVDHNKNLTYRIRYDESLIRLFFGRTILMDEVESFEDLNGAKKWIINLVQDFEVHESHEWLRYNVVPLVNPHPGIIN